MSIVTEPRLPDERDTTDASLLAERDKTDSHLADSFDSADGGSDRALAAERRKADLLLSGTRTREDKRLAVESPGSAFAAGSLEQRREQQDAVLATRRETADAAVAEERTDREAALAGLLAFEREHTDLHLQTERHAADVAVSSRDDLLAIVSHDLRSMLGGIALNAAVLKKLSASDVPGHKVQSCAESIQRFSGRMNRLIGDLLDVASIEAGKLSLRHAPHDPAAIVRDAVESLQHSAAAARVRLTAEAAAGLEPADLDAERILQVLANLIGNALKFTPPGGTVLVRVAPSSEGFGVSVQDSGPGIPAGRLDQIFDRYFQGSSGDGRGLGLGLFIARSIVEAHGGRIWAESPAGRGSTFSFTLPLRQPAALA